MASPVSVPPGLFSLPRMSTLLASLLVALGSGTNYVYSAYSPQLGAKLHITHTKLNVIGLAGNVGVYSTAPFLGRIADKEGPRRLLSGAFILLLVGYSGIRNIFNNGADASGTLSTFNFWLLVICSYMTGAGGNGGLTSSVNATAKSFPDKARATTTGIVLSGFGLSAFFFSTISHTIFKGDTSSFLLLLALGTSCPMILGFFLVRPIPLPPHESISRAEYGEVNDSALDAPVILQHSNDSHSPLLPHDAEDNTPPIPRRTGSELELSPTRSESPNVTHRRSRSSAHRPSFGSAVRMIDSSPNIHGVKLWMTGDFWILFIIMSLLSGTGIMYINNVGSISQALFSKGNPKYDEVVASKWQAAQVSSISITNFMGRIILGMTADFVKNHLHLPRSYCISLVSFLFVISQLMAIATDDVTVLWRASLALGLAYGGLFGLFPAIAIEWFGLAHFSENWGFLSLSPMLGGNIFSIAFGRNLDAHAPPETEGILPPINSTSSAVPQSSLPTEVQCLEGRECYVASLHISIAACCLALALSIWAGWRDRQRRANADYRGKTATEVIWEEEEEEEA